MWLNTGLSASTLKFSKLTQHQPFKLEEIIFYHWLMVLNIFICIFGATLATIIGLTAYFLKARSLRIREKLSPFECGFDPHRKARMPFSIRFFLLAVIFVVFDIEIVLLIPVPLTLNIKNPIITCIGITGFLILLAIGLFHEWREGSLNWTE